MRTLQDLARRAVAVVPLNDWPDDTPICTRSPVDGPAEWIRCGHLDGGAILWRGCYAPESVESLTAQHGEILPDLSSVCGVGALLALAREAWGDSGIGCFRTAGGQWAVVQVAGIEFKDGNAGTALTVIAQGDTEEEALVRALEAAPSRT